MKLNENIKIDSLIKGSFHPILLKEVKKKELKGHDWAALRYLAAEYLIENKEVFGFENKIEELFSVLDNFAAIQDNSLYVGNFDGYYFDEDKILHCFALSEEGRLIALIETGANEDEEGKLNWYLLN